MRMKLFNGFVILVAAVLTAVSIFQQNLVLLAVSIMLLRTGVHDG